MTSHAISSSVDPSGSLTIGRPEVRDGQLDHAGAGTIPAGTILGTVTSTGNFAPFDAGALTGEEVPVAVLLDPSTAGGAGAEPVRVIVGGMVVRQRLIIAADGDASNVDASVRDALKAVGIVVVEAAE